jgi:hypothetical protein
MNHLYSFLRGVILLAGILVLVYYGMVLLNRWNYGAKGLLAAIVIFPLVLYGAGYATDLITFSKLGSMGSVFVSLFVLMCVGAVQRYNYEKEQMAGFRSVADALGLEYAPSVAVDSALGNNPIFGGGFFRTVHHSLAGRYQGVDLMVFNYEYETIDSETPDHYFRTVVVFADPRRDIPEFLMRPKGAGERLLGALGEGGEVEFPEDTEFSKRYSLVGPAPMAVRDVFGDWLRRALVESERSWRIAGLDHRVILYADDRMDAEVKPNPEDLSEYLRQTLTLFQEIRSAAPKASEMERRQ